MLPDVVFGCLHQALPDRVPAEGTSCLWTLTLGRGATAAQGNARRFMLNAVHNGGTGARPQADGLSATAYPSGVRGTPVEITEQISPLVYRRRELRPASGGAGRQQGGHGQIIEIEARTARRSGSGRRSTVSLHPPRGRAGGEPGAAGQIRLDDGTPLAGKGYQEIPAGRRLIVHTPGGAAMARRRSVTPRRLPGTGARSWYRRRRRAANGLSDGRRPGPHCLTAVLRSKPRLRRGPADSGPAICASASVRCLSAARDALS